MKKRGLATVALMLLNQAVFAAQQPWNEWVAGVREEALQQGIRPALFDDAFAGVNEPSRQIKGLMRSQPEHRLSYFTSR